MSSYDIGWFMRRGNKWIVQVNNKYFTCGSERYIKVRKANGEEKIERIRFDDCYDPSPEDKALFGAQSYSRGIVVREKNISSSYIACVHCGRRMSEYDDTRECSISDGYCEGE